VIAAVATVIAVVHNGSSTTTVRSARATIHPGCPERVGAPVYPWRPRSSVRTFRSRQVQGGCGCAGRLGRPLRNCRVRADPM